MFVNYIHKEHDDGISTQYEYAVTSDNSKFDSSLVYFIYKR